MTARALSSATSAQPASSRAGLRSQPPPTAMAGPGLGAEREVIISRAARSATARGAAAIREELAGATEEEER